MELPLLQAAWKIAPALAAGNTFVLKPAELTPHTAILIVDVLDELGLPAGVANLVLGDGAVVGAPLSSHPEIDLISFTGGLVTGRRVAESAARGVKKVALELGGKNPNVVFADADFDAAVDNALNAAFTDSGLVCSAGTRLIVHDSIAERFVDEVVRRAGDIVMGGPFDEKAETGPLISRSTATRSPTTSSAASRPAPACGSAATGAARSMRMGTSTPRPCWTSATGRTPR